MLSTNKLLVTCLALLAAAHVIHCSSPKNTSSQWTCRRFDYGFVDGSGTKSTYWPLYTAQLHTDAYFMKFKPQNIDLFNGRGDHCQLNLNNRTMFIPYQASATTIIMHDFLPPQRMISVDMSKCTKREFSENIINNREDLVQNLFAKMIVYESGFDVIVDAGNGTRTRWSYDQDGKVIDQPRTFLFQSGAHRLYPLSPKLRTSNIVVENYVRNASKHLFIISLLDNDGRLIKQLFQINSTASMPPVNDFSDYLIAYCYKSSDDSNIECVQFDEFGNEKYRSSMNNNNELLGVVNAKEGGVFVFSKTDTEIRVDEMRPGKVGDKSYYFDIKDFRKELIRVTDFDIIDRRFTVLRHTVAPYEECLLCLKNFTLTIEHERNLSQKNNDF